MDAEGEAPEVRIDKSIARGLFNHEVRQTQEIILGGGRDAFGFDPRDIEHFFLKEAFTRLKGKPSFPIQSFRPVARALAAHGLSPCEALYGAKAVAVQGSSSRSFLEASFRKRPVLSDDILSSTACYAFMKKDRLVCARRVFAVVGTGHAIRRYLQRGADVRIGAAVLAPALAEIYARSGLFLFLANIAGRHDGARFAVPFKEGFLLCEVALSRIGAGIEYLLPGDPEAEPYEEGSVERHVHPLLWGAEPGTRMVVKVNTYVGRREMKEGQVALHDLLEGVYQRAKAGIDLLARLEGSFYPTHMPDLQDQASKAARKLDEATQDVVAALSWDRRMSYAFAKEDGIDAARVRLPSRDVELAEKGIGWTEALMGAFGLAQRGGGPFCHSPLYGLYDPPEGSRYGLAEASLAFGLDPYGDIPDQAEAKVLASL